ncbi:ExeA family protein [Luteimonas sp. MC1895]|uniref:ExeA family protein n=1 Tax=Luteimonas sp. MC1895 TaxID=2819513 RepID=UPI0018F0632B|nr:ExeA family protein [Luteimonas sp. MC1895]MBJ6980028.1 AAA family ATPase [Luteimonas sp. MC1895]
MYLEHYGLAEPPFSITPDPRFVYLGERHRDALAHLLFGITQGGGGGFVQLTGEVGTGKTTLSRLLLGQLPDNVRVALVLNPRQDPVQLLETVCEELRIDLDGRRGNGKALVDALNAHLLDAYARGLRVVLVVDEAQALPVETLEQVRLLTNLETDTQKLLQIILIGQPELRDMLAEPGLRQLAQRITARFHLTPLDAAGTAAYLRHRFRVAGGLHFPFDDAAVQRIHLRSGGIPRLVNVLAERALLAGYARDRATIDAALVDEAAREALPPAGGTDGGRGRRWLGAAGVAGVGAAVVIVLAALWPMRDRHDPAAARMPQAGTQTDTQVGTQVSTQVSTQAGAESGTQAGAQADARSAGIAHSGEGPRAIPGLAAAGAPDRAPLGTRNADAIRIDADALDARIAAASNAAAREAAWQSMLQAWSLPHTSTDARAASACAAVPAPGTYCTRGTAHLDRLAALGRPVLLQLESGGDSAWALLQGTDGAHARLLLGDGRVEVERAALQRAWPGRYAAVWRSAAPLAPLPARGASGEAVDWLRARLVDEGVAAEAPPGRPFDESLADSVRRFQRARGLAIDGVVGSETLFALAAADPGPRLERTLD